MNGSDTVENAITVIDAAGHYSVYHCLDILDEAVIVFAFLV